MASITLRAGKYYVRIRRKGLPAAIKTFHRKADAQSWARKIESEMDQGSWVAPTAQVPSFAEAVEAYRNQVAVRMKGYATYCYRFDEFAGLSFAGKPVSDVTPFDLAAWRDQQLQSRKPATVVRKMAMLSALFSWAVKDRGWMERNPVTLVAKPRALSERARVLGSEEVSCLMEQARTSKARWLAPALVVLMSSAMRRGELFALRRRDIDVDAAVARLRDTKNGSARDVPLCPTALAAIQELAELAAPGAESRLIPVGEVGSISTRFQVTVTRAQRAYRAACAESGREPKPGFLEDVRLHDMRHQAITRWASTGGLTLPELMALSGHKTPRMLMRYTHLSASKLAGKLAQLAGAELSGAVHLEK